VSVTGSRGRSAGRRRRDALRVLLDRPSRAGTAVLALEILAAPVALRQDAVLSAPWSGEDG
jgi:hypothetical protein